MAHFVIVVSAAVASYAIPIIFPDLRCVILTVDKITEEERKLRIFNQVFSSPSPSPKITHWLLNWKNWLMGAREVDPSPTTANFTEEEKRKLEIALKCGFSTFLQLQTLATKLRKVQHEGFSAAKKCIDEEAFSVYANCKRVSHSLIQKLNVEPNSRKFDIIAKIAKGEAVPLLTFEICLDSTHLIHCMKQNLTH